MTKKDANNNIIRSFPKDMLAEILKHAASNSITDFVTPIVSSLDLANSSKISSKIIASFRLKTEEFLSSMWVYLSLTGPKQIGCNCCHHDIRLTCSSSSEGQSWEASNNVGRRCDSCFWDHEATLFVVCLGNI
ncbi:hypothetical protein ERO13_D05G172150v2 [Gossypium hirsutum]|uniref:Uncharacterized protein n=2 Tax=Gossypium TaxID=3633 RepID=A0A5D2UWQ2_GOSMU|nr:hypothetical protein ERO13_D05G172150v2 [Gossypium hirsutum]TYH71454.1 hypothetical protein ES332_D05G187100v1 [Gossypium tomentosum]TYI81871.1 hypothetical protein E1A91_D05G183800v1 [Gossypium mustelinum]